MRASTYIVVLLVGFGAAASFHADARPSVKIIHVFAGGTDGLYPSGPMTLDNGILFGTTSAGGNSTCFSGCGTVFEIEPQSGNESVLYSFAGGKDGAGPAQAALTVEKNIIFGTTPNGGAYGFGTIYRIDISRGKESVLYSFKGGNDGRSPQAGVHYLHGVLYGTTANGGNGNCPNNGCGTIFMFDLKTRTETILHTFSGGLDGAYPYSGLTYARGLLYGTTHSVVPNSCSGVCGNLFTIDPNSGAENVVYTFKGGTDGGEPTLQPIYFAGNLYGVTADGGNDDSGTVFRFDPSTGTETVLHSLQSQGTNGVSPMGILLFEHGSLFGTTWLGGTDGVGTIFRLNLKNLNARQLWSFGTEAAQYPTAGLVSYGQSFYGTTQNPGTAYELSLEH